MQLHQVLYKGRVFEVTSSVVQGVECLQLHQGSSVKNCTRVECLRLHQVLYKGRVFAVTSSVVQGSSV